MAKLENSELLMTNPPMTQKKRLFKTQRSKNIRDNVFLWIIRIALGFVFAYPMVWAIITSFTHVDGSSFTSGLFQKVQMPFSTENYKYVIQRRNINTDQIMILQALSNTLILTLVGGAINITVTTIAGYAFAKLNFKGNKVIFRILITSMMIPGVVTMFPTLIVISRLKLWNIWGVILPGASSVFNIFFMRQFFINLPDELGESAEVDGASEFQIFTRIYLPQVKPAVAALAIFNFQGGWNNFLMPYIVLGNKTLVLSTFVKFFDSNHIGHIMAASMLMTLPILLIFIFFQKYFMQSVTISGVKE